LQKRLKKPKVSYFFLNKLIESLDHEQPIEGQKFSNGSYYFKEAEDDISLEQMVGMILKNIKKYSSSQAGSDIKDAVLTVPAHWGFKAKFSLINVGSHNLQISIVQFFGTYDALKEKNIESMRVLSHVSIPNFGGLQFDELLA
jgi:hypothetical protein